MAEKWPYPEGRPSAFFKIENPFEAVIFDFYVITAIREEREKAQTPPSTAGGKYDEAVRRTSPSVNQNIQRHLDRQQQKRLKNQENIIESDQ